ncbi:MAG: ATP-binding protein [Bacteroidia bacterium]|nr:ATP-binding protein [Bacteroidia bacterium]
MNHQLVSIKELVNHSLESLIIPEKININITDETANAEAMLDSEQMMQVLTNLVKNAIDAMPDGGTINIKMEDTLGDVIISISDTGTGIKEEDRVKIFEPFFTTKSIGQGTGLGLATAYGVVKMHKGQITAESNNDPAKGPTGTSFKIMLPRRKE